MLGEQGRLCQGELRKQVFLQATGTIEVDRKAGRIEGFLLGLRFQRAKS
jgi:hypothetical protein